MAVRGKGNETGRGRIVHFPGLLSCRLFFRENGSTRKTVRWVQVTQGLDGHSRAIYYYTDQTSGRTIFSSRYLALSQHWIQNFKIKKSRKHHLSVKVKEYLNLISEFLPKGNNSLTTIPWDLRRNQGKVKKINSNKMSKYEMVYNKMSLSQL